jgi:hypothetical protein
VTDDEAKALGLRVLATRRWLDKMQTWPEGALDCDGRRIVFATYYDGPINGYVQAVEVTNASICVEDDLDGAALGAPDLRDAATMGAALALWQARPGHVFRVPCPVLTNAAAYGLTDPRTIRALVDAMGDILPQ